MTLELLNGTRPDLMDINARTLKSLEWDKIKAFLAAECSCAGSRELALALAVVDDPQLVKRLLRESSEGLHLLEEGFDLAQEGLPDFREQLQRLHAGAPLAARDFLDLKTILVMSRKLKLLLGSIEAEEFPELKIRANSVFVFTDLVDAIDIIIDEAGGIRDDASPLLRKLRREVARLNSHTKDELLRIINSPQSKCLQEPLYTIRNGRHVLPVLASMRHAIEGIVHDSSSTGLTIYVEPKAVVELTNKIRLCEAEIEREIERLLWELSAAASQRVEQIELSFETLVDSDFIAARARLARKYRGTMPRLSEKSELKFKQARHPLLILHTGKIDSVIPNDIWLDTECPTLIITGPNTGGKTVYLKTAGLLSLMVRSGLLLPVEEGSTACLFEGVFADIGDEQSLEQNLSTFSSHMGNIVEITRKVNESTLVLLDEIGAGTDPREGVILARVILSHLNQKGAITICSTHYGELKTLAHSQSGFANASMEFDDKTLTPSYRMRAGVAGNSHAIAVAARLGLAAEMVAEAEISLEAEKEQFEHKIDLVEQRLRSLAEREDEFTAKQAEMLKLEAELKERTKALEEEFRRSRNEASNQFQDDYHRAKKTINELTADLQKIPSLARAQQAKEKLDSLKKDLDWLDKDEYAAAQKVMKAGQTVRVLSLGGQIGTIEAMPESNGESAQVKVGRLKVKVALSELEVMQSAPAKGKGGQGKGFGHLGGQGHGQHQSFSRSRDNKGAVASTSSDDPIFVRSNRNTLDLRGQRVDEGLSQLVRFIDEAYLEQLSPLMVIHGHGTGAMKAAVREFLQTCLYKNKSRPGEMYEGGDGVTVVNFK